MKKIADQEGKMYLTGVDHKDGLSYNDKSINRKK